MLFNAGRPSHYPLNEGGFRCWPSNYRLLLTARFCSMKVVSGMTTKSVTDPQTKFRISPAIVPEVGGRHSSRHLSGEVMQLCVSSGDDQTDLDAWRQDER
ncbi:hypothetical protein H0G86_011372 [Trichoderma simmonsii]|uniref:Uncharacterized protein n=1 Tax=Trichoderma simmonsii TaxID=1491479 RepID=A0A8G0LRB4_9HYPO|nr:hypothetical protein H0G86_011372 [Trichoderma simmonsii]